MWLFFFPQEVPKNPSRATVGLGVVILGSEVLLLPQGRIWSQTDNFCAMMLD